MKTTQLSSIPHRMLLVGLLALALALVLGWSTVVNNLWSLRFLNERWGSGAAAPAPPGSHASAERWLAEQAGIEGQLIEAANRLSELGATGDRFSQRSLGHMLAARGDVSVAYDLWEEVGDFNSVNAAAAELNESRNVDGAYTGLRIAYRIDPQAGTNPLAGFLVQQNAREEAIAVLRDALLTDSPDYLRANWMNQLGGYLIAQEDFDEAAKIYEEMLNLPGRRLEAYLGLAKVASAEDDLPAASTFFELAREAAPYDGRPYFETGRWLTELEQYEEADTWLREAVQRSSDQFGYVITYADNARRAGAYGTSVERYQRVLAHWPNEARAYWGLADAYRLAGDLEAAQAAVADAIRLSDPAPVGYWLRAASLAEELDETDEALAAYKAALKIDPENRAAQQGVARLRDTP